MPRIIGKWSEADHQRLVELAGTMTPAEIGVELGRTESAIRNRAKLFGISIATVIKDRRVWTYDEQAFLFKNHKRLTIGKMAAKLKRTYNSVKEKCRDLGLDCKMYGYKNHKTVYSAEDVELSRALFDEGLSRRVIAEKLEVPYARVCAWVNMQERVIE